jgi:Antibiotic biosynthesis monooxygenase
VQCEAGYSVPPTTYIDVVIVRVLTARVSEQNAGEFNDLLRKQLDELRAQPGLVYAKLARRLGADRAEEVMLFEEWQTPDDLWAWTGGRLNVPRLLPGSEQLIDQLTIAHYEALDMDMDEDSDAPATTLPDDVRVRGV